uniref:Uncharacterized protein n=1 Tax=Glossina pallidipes TaxID=7398 RepID=A0A1B0AFG2_GLOPL
MNLYITDMLRVTCSTVIVVLSKLIILDKITIKGKIIGGTPIRDFTKSCYNIAIGILPKAGLKSAILDKRRLHFSSQQANADNYTEASTVARKLKGMGIHSHTHTHQSQLLTFCVYSILLSYRSYKWLGECIICPSICNCESNAATNLAKN